MFINDFFKEVNKRKKSFHKHSDSIHKSMKERKERQRKLHQEFEKMQKDDRFIEFHYQNKEQ